MVKNFVDRKNILDEILRLEDQIKILKYDPIYLRIKRNLNTLERKRFGSSIVSIASPDNHEKILRMRYNSLEMKEVILRYRERKNNFDDKIDKLFEKKQKLQEQLFSY